MPVTAQQALSVYTRADRLYTAEQVDAALARMAEQITRALHDSDPLVLCVMTGGIIAAGKLLTQLDFPLQLDYLHATRYTGQTQGGTLHWLARPSHPLQGRVILIIDDILDEGVTLAAIVDECRRAGARAVHTAVLVDKKHARKNGMRANFVGLEVDDRYVFGYGMDYKGYLRNAPGIFAAQDEDS